MLEGTSFLPYDDGEDHGEGMSRYTPPASPSKSPGYDSYGLEGRLSPSQLQQAKKKLLREAAQLREMRAARARGDDASRTATLTWIKANLAQKRQVMTCHHLSYAHFEVK